MFAKVVKLLIYKKKDLIFLLSLLSTLGGISLTVPFKLRLKTEKTIVSLFFKKEASSLFEARLRFTVFRFVVPWEGIEPSLRCQNWILNPARLPIPPPRLNL